MTASAPLLRPGDVAVCTTFGTAGDLVPFVAVARALQDRGVHVRFATSTLHEDAVRGAGLDFVPLAPSRAQLEASLGADVPAAMRRAMHKVTGARFAIRDVLGPFLPESHAQLDRACDGAQLLLSHVYSFTAPLVAQRRGLAWRSIALQPLPWLSPFDPAVLSELVPLHRLQPALGAQRYARILSWVKRASRPWFAPVDELRASLGLAASPSHPLFDDAHAPLGQFGLFDPLLLRDPRGAPPNAELVGFCHADGSDGTLPGELSAFLDGGPPPVVFTLGTSAVHTPGRFFAAASRACARRRLRAVLLVGPDARPASLPPGQIAVAFASHAALFPRARAVVHQGGIGTCAQALRAGRPQLVVPFGNDQPDNAARLEALGVARVLRSWRLRGLDHALDPLLADALAARAAEVRGRLLPEDGAQVLARRLAG